MPSRPSPKELSIKVCEALAAIEEGRWQTLDDPYLVASLEELELENEDALIDLTMELLESIRRIGPDVCYAGGKPPQKSYKPKIQGLDLWAFVCDDPRKAGRPIYLKFALKKGVYIHVSCHEDRP